MPNKMLIDASHPEETRVVVTRGNRIEEFDFESQDKKQLRGNIYLARVTRVEPSLQAAFVEYGGNRHGFLAFSEIHPDYYQIPMADRQALLRADAEAAEAEDEEDEEERSGRRRRRNGKNRDRNEKRKASSSDNGDEAVAASSDHEGDDHIADIEPFEATPFLSNSFAPTVSDDSEPASDQAEEESPEAEMAADETADEKPSEGDEASEDDSDDKSGPAMAAAIEGEAISEELDEAKVGETAELDERAPAETDGDDEDDHEDNAADEVESVGADDAIEEAQPRRRANRRQYKIQEVIKRRQILLVQVVKEERGNKGAALTTYLSLAGRYSVLMPNTARGGGISRKITNVQDRKRLKEVVRDLEVPRGMGIILRTAGESRTKPEIKRDYEYLMRMWENVRTLTLQSTAPALVYEEGSLIKRSVRDLYNKDIDEILVSGEEGYREAKDFMRLLMPSHAKVVQPFRDTVPIFARSGIEAQLDRMLQPQVNLKSGGYIIINQTEALVAIDVNSGRSTKEHSIEDTALQTNLEAADEVARQLRLRDLAGLIVVDFIDMEENRNNRAVEKRMKDALKNDRARIQVGRISHFGLLEMSRQRIRASVLESTTQTCPHCGGTGHVRSESSVGLHVIRAIEEYLLKDTRNNITVRTPVATCLYVLNHKRSTLVELEKRFGLAISLEADETLGSQHYAILKGTPVEKPVIVAPPSFDTIIEEEDEDLPMEPFDGEADEEVVEVEQQGNGGNGEREHGDRDDRKRKRRRRRRGGRDRGEREHTASSAEDGDQDLASSAEEDASVGDEDADGEAETSARDADGEHKKRRRGKRGGRRNRREGEDGEATASETEAAEASSDEKAAPFEGVTAEAVAGIDPEGEASPAEAVVVDTDAEVAVAPAEEAPAKPAKAPRVRKPRKTAAAKAEEAAAAAAASEAAAEAPVTEAPVEAVEASASEPVVETPAPVAAEPDEEPRRASRRRATSATEEPAAPVVTSTGPEEAKPEGAAEAPRKGGWWQRKSFF